MSEQPIEIDDNDIEFMFDVMEEVAALWAPWIEQTDEKIMFDQDTGKSVLMVSKRHCPWDNRYEHNGYNPTEDGVPGVIRLRHARAICDFVKLKRGSLKRIKRV